MPELTSSFYEDVTFLKQNYNYEQINKQRALKSRSHDLMVAAAIAYVGGSMLVGFIGSDWSTAFSLPCGIVVGGMAAAPFFIWSNHLRKKVKAMDVHTAYLFSVGRMSELGPALFSNEGQLGYNAIGIGFKTSF